VDPAQAAIWGLMRSAQTEHPGVFQVVDLDEDPASVAALATAVRSPEPQIAVRAGELHVPRLVRALPRGARDEPRATSDTRADDRWRTSSLLVTGAGGVIGSALGRHAVAVHDVGHVVLLSRRGERAARTAALAAALRERGALVTVEACDAADRDRLAEVIGRVPSDFPLRGVIHAAGVAEDAVLHALTPEHLDKVLRAKSDAVAHLDELTRGLALEWFVTCSSAAGWWGTAGQANYAAANACVDALVQRRRAAGFPALSLAWGLWEERSDISGKLDDTDLSRLARTGIAPLPTSDALTAFDAALALDEPVLLPVRLDTRDLADGTTVPLLAKYVRKQSKPPAAEQRETVPSGGGTLGDRLAAMSAQEREQSLRQLVREEAAAVLNHSRLGAVDLDRGFLDLGFTSLTALELRNRIGTAIGLALSPTLIFDHPTPGALARHLSARLMPSSEEVVTSLNRDIGKIGERFATLDDETLRTQVKQRLQDLLKQWGSAPGTDSASDSPGDGDIESASADLMFDLIDSEFGTP
jgi:NADP-dependent 3-hydroxy acid dehydrogenase YdfG/acyl carrier protein